VRYRLLINFPSQVRL